MKIDQAILQNQNKLILNQNDKIAMQTYDNFYQELKNYIFNNKELKTFKKIKDELEFRHFRIDQNIDLEVDISDLNKEMKGEFDLLTTHFFNKDIKCVAEFKIITKKQKYDYSKAYGKQIQRQLFALRKLYKNNFRYMHIVFNLETKKINTTFISGEWLQYVIEQEKIDNFKNKWSPID